eukprot:9484089-Pyramimonas_sp.AAC.1
MYASLPEQAGVTEWGRTYLHKGLQNCKPVACALTWFAAVPPSCRVCAKGAPLCFSTIISNMKLK